jgi:hypothetical protein
MRAGLVSSDSREILRWVGLVAMVGDHCAWAFLPGWWWLGMVGRISYPLFAWGCAEGLRTSSDRGAYLARLFGCGAVSQVGFCLVYGMGANDLLCMCFGGLLVVVVESRREWWPVIGASVVAGSHVHMVLMVPILFYFGEDLLGASLLVWGVNLIFGGVGQAWAVLALLIVWAVDGVKMAWRLPRWFNYGFYPGHLISIGLARIWLGG